MLIYVLANGKEVQCKNCAFEEGSASSCKEHKQSIKDDIFKSARTESGQWLKVEDFY